MKIATQTGLYEGGEAPRQVAAILRTFHGNLYMTSDKSGKGACNIMAVATWLDERCLFYRDHIHGRIHAEEHAVIKGMQSIGLLQISDNEYLHNMAMMTATRPERFKRDQLKHRLDTEYRIDVFERDLMYEGGKQRHLFFMQDGYSFFVRSAISCENWNNFNQREFIVRVVKYDAGQKQLVDWYRLGRRGISDFTG